MILQYRFFSEVLNLAFDIEIDAKIVDENVKYKIISVGINNEPSSLISLCAFEQRQCAHELHDFCLEHYEEIENEYKDQSIQLKLDESRGK